MKSETHKTYIGITIGPIIKTISKSKDTRSLWASSYIFSDITRRILNKLLNYRKDINIILPYVDFEKGIEVPRVSRYPDRIIFESIDGDFEALVEITKKIKDEIAYGISDAINISIEDIRAYIEKYFKIYFLEKKVLSEGNPIIELSKYLDCMELHNKVINNASIDIIDQFLNKSVIKGSYLEQEILKAYSEDFINIKSIPEIAHIELNDDFYQLFNNGSIKDNDSKHDKYYQEYISRNPSYKKAHKYIAVVQADGDNVGEILKTIGGDYNKIRSFSKAIFEFSKQAEKIINIYGGQTIYAGGDDLLFLVPVVNNGNSMAENLSHRKAKNIFELISKLDLEFNRIFNSLGSELDIKYDDKKPSMSYGVYISYYKDPLYESLEEAGKLLFSKAKENSIWIDSSKEKIGSKNSIAVKYVSHSGQCYEICENKESKSYKLFLEMLERFKDEEDRFETMRYNLRNDKIIICEILKNSIGDNFKYLDNYFINKFDEDIHRQDNGIHSFIDCVCKLLKYSYIESDQYFDKTFTFLRFLKLLNEGGA